MRTRLKFATDEEYKNFEENVSRMFIHFKKIKNQVYAGVLNQVLADNIKLFNKVQELENEIRTERARSKEADSDNSSIKS